MILWLVGLAALIFAIGVILSVVWFYRDPERETLTIPNGIFSPADGVVTSIRRLSSGSVPLLSKDGRTFKLSELTGSEMFAQDGVLVSISISPFDVHVIRSPVKATVEKIIRIKGEMGWMKDPSFEVRNERVSFILKGENLTIGVVIIGAPIATSVRTLIETNETVNAGQRIAIIRLGSQADIILPDAAAFKMHISCFQNVKAGQTLIAERDEKGNATESEIDFQSQIHQHSSVPTRFFLFFLLIASLFVKISNHLVNRGRKG